MSKLIAAVFPPVTVDAVAAAIVSFVSPAADDAADETEELMIELTLLKLELITELELLTMLEMELELELITLEELLLASELVEAELEEPFVAKV